MRIATILTLALLPAACASVPHAPAARRFHSGPSTSAPPLPLAQSSSPARDTGRPGSLFTIVAGSRSLDDDVAWEQIDKPFVIGLESVSGLEKRPIGLEVGLSFARDSVTVQEGGTDVDVDNSFLETSIGGRAVFGKDRFLPYVGAGAALVLASISGEAGGPSVSDDDATVGFYIHAGILFRITGGFYMGLDGRLLTGTSVELFGLETDADYTQLTGVLAWGF